MNEYDNKASACAVVMFFKENLNASKPSDKSQGLGGNIVDCRDKNSRYMV